MDYGNLLKRSFELAWRYKSLWFFGLFAGWGSTFNIPGDFPGFKAESRETWDAFRWDSLHAPFDTSILVPLLIAALILLAVFLIIHLISVPALIDGVNKIARGGVYRFGSSFSRGVDFFWRFLGLLILEIVAFIVSIIPFILVIIVIPILGILLIIPGGIILAYFWTSLFELARRVIVVRDCTIGDSLSEAFLLIKQRLSETIVIFLLMVVLAIAFAIATLIMWLIIGIPIGGVVWAVTHSVAAGLVLAILFGLPVTLVVGGYFGTFFTTLYTLFYFELVEPSAAQAPVGTVPPGPTA